MYCSFCIIETTNIAFGNRCNVEDLRIFCNKVKKKKISWNHKNKEMCYNKISLLTLNFNILINYETCYNNHIIDWVLLDSKPWTLAKWIFNHVSNKWHMSLINGHKFLKVPYSDVTVGLSKHTDLAEEVRRKFLEMSIIRTPDWPIQWHT